MEIEKLSEDQLRKALAEAQRKIAELEAPDAGYRQLYKTAPYGILIADAATGNITDINPALTYLTGYPPEDFLGKRLWETEPFKAVEASRISFRKPGGEGSVKHEELTIRTKQGRNIKVMLISNLYKAGGRMTVHFTIVDITEHKHADAEALREAEKWYQALFEGANDAVFIMVRDRFVECNRMTLEMFGCGKEDIIGHSPWEFSPKQQPDGRDSQGKAMEYINAAFEGIPQRFSWQHARKDGSPFDAEVSLSGIEIEGRKFLQAFVRDITDQKHTVEKIRQLNTDLEQRIGELHTMLEVIPIGIAIAEDPESRVIRGNKAFTDMLGLPPGTNTSLTAKEEERPRNFKVFQNGRELSPGELPIQKAASRGAILRNVEEEVVRDDGVKLHLMTSVAPLFDPDRKIRGAVAAFYDITDLKQAEEALRQKTEELDNFFNLSLDLLLITNKNGTIRKMNQEWEEIFGYERGELIGKKGIDYVHPDDLKISLAASDTILSGKPLINFQNRIRAKDGSYRWIEWKSLLVGRSIYTAARDITERMLYEKELKDNQDRLSLAAEATQLGMYDWNIVTGESIWTQQYEIMFDYPSTTTTTTTTTTAKHSFLDWMNRIHPDDRPGIEERLNRSMSEHTLFEGEYRIIWRDGSIHWIEEKGNYYYDETGKPVRMLGTMREITARKKQEEELKKLNRTLRAVSDASQAMMHSTDEMQLLHDVCRIIVEDCGYSMAWIGYAGEDDKKTVRPVASAGVEEGYLRTLNVTWADDELGHGTTGTAIRTGKPGMSRNMLTDPSFAPWKEEARKRGYASALALPLMAGDKAFGAISLYSAQPDPFTEDEVSLLQELSRDLEYGISSIRLHSAKTKAEEEIKMNNERLELALKAGSSGTYDWNAKQDKNLLSEELLALYGLKKEEFGGSYEDWLECLVPEDREPVAAEVIRSLENGEFASEFRIRRHDTGEIRWMHSRGHIYFDHKGKPSRMVGINVDITERKKAEEALEESRATLETFFEASPVIIILGDDDFRFINTDATTPTYFGLSRETIKGKRADDIAAEFMERFGPMMRKVIETGEPNQNIEVHSPVSGRPGEEVFWQGSFFRVPLGRDKWGIGIVGIDITDIKRAENALRESEERYRITLESMHDAVSIQSIKDAKYLFVNQPFIGMTGYTQEEIIGKTSFELGLPVEFEDHNNYMECILSSTEKRLEMHHRVKDGTVLDTLLSCTPVRYRGEDCAVVVMTDITDFKHAEDEKKRLEIQLAQTQKMEALGTLAGGVAHDFNNILTAIMGYTEMARLNAADPEKVKKTLGNLMKSSHRAKDLVSQILTFSRHAAGEFTPLTLNYTIEESLNMLRAMIPMNIEIRRELGTPARIMADPSQINQMMVNLCINAAQAMGVQGGLLEVGVDKVTIDEGQAQELDLAAGPFLRIMVRDTGHGMPPEVLTRIFEPYFTTKKEAGSTGLGLSIVHGIVKRHKGAVTCRSTVQKGTTFTIYLPEAIAVKEEAAEPVGITLPVGTERILFVDDEKALVEVSENLLSSLGYKVTASTSSVAALDLFKQDPSRFDLVVTDMTMPEMMGDKLAQHILAIRPDIPILMYTGFSEYITENRARSLGIRQLILKPFEIEDLAKNIRKELDKNKIQGTSHDM